MGMRRPAGLLTCAVLVAAFVCSGCAAIVNRAKYPDGAPLIVMVPSAVDARTYDQSVRDGAQRIPAVLFEELRSLGIVPTTAKEGWDFQAEIKVHPADDHSLLMTFAMKRMVYKEHGRTELHDVFVETYPVTDVTYRAEIRQALADLLTTHFVQKFASFNGIKLPAPPVVPSNKKGPVPVAVRVPTSARTDGWGDASRQAAARLSAIVLQELRNAGFQATTGLDYNVDSSLLLDWSSGQPRKIRCKLTSRGTGQQLEMFSVDVQDATLVRDVQAMVQQLRNSIILRDYAKNNGLAMPGATPVVQQTVAETSAAPGSRTPATTEPVALKAPTRIVLVPLRSVGSVPKETCQVLTNMLTSSLHEVKGATTIGEKDIGALLSIEKQKDFVGCDSTVCATELGAALGADMVLYGEIGAIGSKYNITVNVIRSRSGEVGARISHNVPRNEDDLSEHIPTVIEELVNQLNGA